MARLKSLAREQMNAEQAAVLDAIVARGGRLGGPYEAYIRIPAFMRLNQQMGDYLRGNSLPARLRLLAVLVVVRHWNAPFAWATNAREALKEGLAQEMIDAINRREVPSLERLADKAVYAVASQILARKTIREGTYSSALAVLGETALVDLVVTVGFYTMVCITLTSFEIEAPGDAEQKLL